MHSTKRRVVITGLGLISPLGNSYAQLWEGITEGRSGIDVIQSIPIQHFPSDVGGECRQFTGDIADFGPLDKSLQRNIKKGLKLMCREIQIGVAAAQLALADANITEGSFDPRRIGTMFGSDYTITQPFEFLTGIRECLNEQGQFDFNLWAERGLPKVEPLWLLKYLPNMPASHVAIFNDLQGPSNSITVREASSNLSIAEGAAIIQRGGADAIVAGSTGSRIHLLRTIHVSMQEQLADRHSAPANGDPARSCRPFDQFRTGQVLGEGAGAIILESLESAQSRGVKIWGEVIGSGSSSVADPEGRADCRTAFENVIHSCMESADLKPADLGHVHAHGLGATKTDIEEAQALNQCLPDVPVTAAKSYFANLGSGSGVVELIASLLAMQNDHLFPILNCDKLDPACPIRLAETGQSAGNSFLNLNTTPQGQCSGVVVRKIGA
jgi:3-oxoacyl-[acyl-carrier-protein] synthase II